MRYVLALDQGTTSSRAIVFDQRGAARASAQKEFRQHFPQPGWVEHDALEILRTQLAWARAAMEKAQLEHRRVNEIGITNLRERAERGELAFGTIGTRLAWQLSGGRLRVTDPGNAWRTMLYDIHGGGWD